MSSDLEDVGERIEALLAELRASTNERGFAAVEDLVRLLTDLYGEGLARTVSIGGPALLGRLVDDDLVSGLLLLHGLHPEDLAGRVQRAVDAVAPGIRKGGGDVHLGSVTGAAVRVVVTAGTGCGSTAEAIRANVTKALWDAAPDAESIDVELAIDTSPVLTPVRLGTKRVVPGPSAGVR